MNAKTILYATDFSPASEQALEMAASLARDSQATLIILHVEEPPVAYGGGELYYGIEGINREELLAKLRDTRPADPNVACLHKLMVGDPAEAILQLVESENVDLIVMGTHGRRGITRLLMGSVAETVVRRANCPVLTVKQPAAIEAPADVEAAAWQ
jgi:universal stress protein A